MVKMEDPNHCNNHFAGAQERIIKKSYIQRIVDYIAMITGNGKIQNIYIYPDISVEQGSKTLDILSYKDKSGRSKLDIKLPTGSKFKYFSKTQDGTEFQAELNLNVSNKNAVQRKGRTEKKKRQTNENVVTQGQTTTIDKNIQIEDNPQFRHLDNFESFLDRNLGQSIQFQNASAGSCRTRKEQEKGLRMAIAYRGEEIRLKSYSTEEIYKYEETCLLILLKYSKGNMQLRKTCRLFICRDKMYSPSAFLQKVQGQGLEEFDQAIYVTAFSETDGYLNIEFMKGISKELAILIAKVIQNNDLELMRLADILRLLETNDIFEQSNLLWSDFSPEDSITGPVKDNDNHLNDINDNSFQNNGMDANQESADRPIQHHVNNNTDNHSLLNDKNKFIEPKTLNVENNNTEKELRNNTGLRTQWTDRSKMKNSKVRTQSKPVRELKIYLQSVEVDFAGLVNEYFEDNMIRQAVYGFYSPDVIRRNKTSCDRPNVPWPSMHPLLPYKLRYLDENEETSDFHRYPEQHNEVQNDPNTENLDNFSSDVDTDQYDSCTSECTDEIDNDNDRDDD